MAEKEKDKKKYLLLLLLLLLGAAGIAMLAKQGGAEQNYEGDIESGGIEIN